MVATRLRHRGVRIGVVGEEGQLAEISAREEEAVTA
jgi:hypothetical protein